jgi:serine/threonine protein kinase
MNQACNEGVTERDRFAGEQLRERLKREALAAARLSGHPHVVTILDVGESRGRESNARRGLVL